MKDARNRSPFLSKLIRILLFLLVFTWFLQAQQILLDKSVEAGGLTLFQDLNERNHYYYLPDKPRLATDEHGRPQFSFLRYVETTSAEGSSGGILHALITLSVTPEQVRKAQNQLLRQNPEAVIKGPIMYRSGKFALISSFVDTRGNFSTQVVGLGNAPILDGQKVAVFIQLTQHGAKVLWESFKSGFPDISFSFDMKVAGFRSPRRAEIIADFDRIYAHRFFGIGLATRCFQAEIKEVLDELRQDGAIKLVQVGKDEELGTLIGTAYKKLTAMMFSPVTKTPTPSKLSKGKGLLDRASDILKKQEIRKPVRTSGRNLGKPSGKGDSRAWSTRGPSFTGVGLYEMKKKRHKGIFRISLNKYTADTITISFDENIGALTRLMEDENHFRQVNLDDPLYKRREIVVMVDGVNAQDFGQFINFVTVHLKKRHDSGMDTYDEVRIDRKNFNSQGNNFKLVYGWKGDSDRWRWKSYQYQTEWSFFGGHRVKKDWQTSNAGALNLLPPYQRRSVELVADPAKIKNAGVRAIIVKVFYRLGESEQFRQVTLNAFKNRLSDRIDFLLPKGKVEYDYEISWLLRGNRSVSSGLKRSSGSVLFVDELPEGVL